MKALAVFLFYYAFASPLGSGSLPNGFAAKAGDPKTIQVSVLDQEQANSLFRKFAGNKEISFRYLPEGCYARATLMNEMAEKENIVMGRIYAEGKLQVKSDNYRYPFVKWGWHSASLAYVRQANGSDQVMVFDPSLFNKPVTVAEWTMKMSAKDPENNEEPRLDKIYYGSRAQYYGTKWETYKNQQNPKDPFTAKMLNKIYKEHEDTSLLVVPHPATSRSINEKGNR